MCVCVCVLPICAFFKIIYINIYIFKIKIDK